MRNAYMFRLRSALNFKVRNARAETERMYLKQRYASIWNVADSRVAYEAILQKPFDTL